MAAEKGFADAQNKLGVIYYDGQEVLQDYNVAVKWFQKATAQGYHWGQYNLGIAYLEGAGVSKDINTALIFFRKAAAKGNEPAKKKLKEMGEG